VCAVGFAQNALGIIQQVAHAADDTEIIGGLDRAKQALGAEHAVFASFVRDDVALESFRFLLACDPAWCIEYLRHGWYAHDPWLFYAETHSEPICASKISLRTPAQRVLVELAGKYGVASAYVVPAPSGGSITRLGVLVLGSRYEHFFEDEAAAPIKVLARSLAMELHEWWVRRVRQEIIEKCHLTPEDLVVLTLERQGLGSKQIAHRLNTSPSAVDSRFQRLNAKFNMPTRKATARVAAEYGVI
jgi:DNA-binding CsgD family transcriptional regulator